MIWHQNMQPHDCTGIQWYCLMYYKPKHLLFSNLISTGLKDNVKSSGLTYAIPFPVMVWHGTKDVLLSFSTKDTIPVCSGNILTLFLATSGIEISCMYNCLEA